MSLAAHLVELRRRLIISVIGLAVGMVAAFLVTDQVIWYITEPIRILDEARGTETPFAQLVFSAVSSGFDLRLRMAFSIGLLFSAPVWLWQVWAYVMPGLTRKEIRYTLSFVGAAIPLFFAGTYVALLVAPHVIDIMSTFVPEGGVNYFDAQTYYDFILKFVLVVGIAFVLPVFLVALNVAGILSGRSILAGWRVAILVASLFAAITTPAADIFSMLLLAGILVVLYFGAAGLTLLLDRRKRKRAVAEGLAP